MDITQTSMSSSTTQEVVDQESAQTAEQHLAPEGEEETKGEELVGLDDEQDNAEVSIDLYLTCSNESDSKQREMKTRNETRFSVPKSLAMISELVRTALESDPDCTEIPLNLDNMHSYRKGEIPNLACASETLERIVEYMNLRNGKEGDPPKRPVISNNMAENASAEDAKFMDSLVTFTDDGQPCDTRLVMSVYLAANYLNIPNLLQLCAAKIATLMKGVAMEDMRDRMTPKPFSDS